MYRYDLKISYRINIILRGESTFHMGVFHIVEIGLERKFKASSLIAFAGDNGIVE